MSTTTTPDIETDVVIDLRIPGDVFRAVDPASFDFPTVVAERIDAPYGVIYTVTTHIDGIDGKVDLLRTIDADFDDVQRAANRFNDNTLASWGRLLEVFFAEQRRANGERRAELDKDEASLLDLEAGFLR